MNRKRYVSALLSVCMITAAGTSALADTIKFGSRSEINWDDVGRGWGSVSLAENKILSAKEGEKIENIDSKYSVFDGFKFMRGQNYYDGSSTDTAFVYDSSSNGGPRLSDGKYFYGVYNPSNNKKNFKVDFAARFDSDMKTLIAKGDISMAVVAETKNAKGTFHNHTGIANLRMYSNASPIKQEITTTDSKFSGARTVSAGWKKLDSDITRVALNLRSERGGLKKWNGAAVYNVRVYLRDEGKPTINSSGIYDTGFGTRKNVNGDTVHTAKVGDTVYYYVGFDERVKVDQNNAKNLKLVIKSNPSGSEEFKADYDKTDGNRLVFKYTIPDNTGRKTEIEVFGTPTKLIGGTKYITDIAGNPLESENVGGYNNTTHTIDDTLTLLRPEAFTDDDKLYPITMPRNKSCNLYGEIPQEIISSSKGRQKEIFPKSTTSGPIFKITLNEEIQKSSLSSSTRLKLRVYDADKKPTDRYVYASLAGARTVGVNDKVQANGIKSDAYTELYFRYCPEELQNLPVYYLSFAGDYNSGSFVCAEDLLTTGGEKLKNISDLEVDCKKLVIDSTYTNLAPLKLNVMIDTAAPSLDSSTIPSTWEKELSGDSTLTFKDSGAFDTNGAYISLVYYDDNNNAKYLNIKSSGSKTAQRLQLAAQSKGSREAVQVNLGGISLASEYPENRPVYIEYEISDRAGNKATNKGMKNLRAYIDSTAPTVKGVSEARDGKDAVVSYEVTDAGVGEISPLIEYTLKNLSDQNSADENYSTNDANQQIRVSAKENSLDSWQVFASFADTVGNRSAKFPSGIFMTASREFAIGLKDSAANAVSDVHVITAEALKMPEKDVSFDVSFGWVKGSAAPENSAKTAVSFKSVSELTSYNFANEEIQRQYGGGDLFAGEYTLVIKATMMPENISQLLRQSYYFDTTAPEGRIAIGKSRDGVNSVYSIAYNLFDDAADYKGGAFVKDENIELSGENAPKMELYIGEKLADSFALANASDTKMIDFYRDYALGGEYTDETQAYVKILFSDKFGHKSEITSEKMAVDFKAPEISEITVKPALKQYRDGSYIINDFTDISEISAVIDDNAKDKIDVSYMQGGEYKRERLSAGEVSIKNPIRSDFSERYEDGAYKYYYTFDAVDMGGNASEKSVSFIVDKQTPEIYSLDLSGADKMTNADSVTLSAMYRTDMYETTDDIEASAGSAEVNKTGDGKLEIKVTENGSYTLTVRDFVGKISERSFEINCFDREKPSAELISTVQTPEGAPSKYGEIVIRAHDNDSLKVLSAAVVQGEPSENDFFTDTASAREIAQTDEGGVYEENGYFGDKDGFAYAKLENVYAPNENGGAGAGYKLTYGALPSGSYNVYVRVEDNAGNVLTEKLCSIEASGERAQTDVTYTPNTITGGAVTVRTVSDIPTMLQYNADDEDNISVMQENVRRSRQNGYTYSFGGKTVTLPFDEARDKYIEIKRKIESGREGELTDEEKYIYKNDKSDDYGSKYDYYFNVREYTTPVLDIYDYLSNECFYRSESMHDEQTNTYFSDIVTDGKKLVWYSDVLNITDQEGDAIRRLMRSGIGGESDLDEVNLYSMDVMDYPADFDKMNIAEFSSDELKVYDKDLAKNPFEYMNYITKDEALAFFGEDFDLSLLEKSGDDYVAPVENGDERFYISDLPAALQPYFKDCLLYASPFGSMGEPLTLNEIDETVKAIEVAKEIRETAAQRIAEKYIRSYVGADGGGYSMQHMLKFKFNKSAEYILLDRLGRTTVLPIEIDWIDPSAPHVPEENIEFLVGGAPFDEAYTNAESAEVSVTLPSDGIYAEYYLANIPDGAAAAEETVDGYDMPVYKSFTLSVTDNTDVEFDVVNPSVIGDETKTALAHQVYSVNRFDRNAPTAKLNYLSAKASDGTFVNTDVTVSLSDISDDFTENANIKANELSHTFTENGDFTFTLTDDAGNVSYITASVDYIDKTPVNLTAKVMSGAKEIDSFKITSNADDYKNTSVRYDYSGGYLNEDAEVYIYSSGSLVKVMKVSDSDEHSYEYTSRSSSKGTLTISGMKFDMEPPSADVSYSYTKAAGNVKDYVTANISLSDNISSDIKLLSVTGRDDSAKLYDTSDVKENADGTRSVVFKNNGYAKLMFADEAGNTTEVNLNVSTLERSQPRAFVSYSTKKLTNGDVTANISLDKIADYQIYDENGTLLRDYGGTYSSYISYTFTDNGSRVFKFRDTSANETDGLIATVDNIDKQKPVLTARVEYDVMYDDSNNRVSFPGCATIVLEAQGTDILEGNDADTVFITNAAQSKYHTVMNNGRYNFKYMDEAGNFDTIYVDVTDIDKTAPTASDSGNPTSWTNEIPNITVSANRKAGGGEAYVVQNGEKYTSVTFNPTENAVYSFMITDVYGNSSTHTVDVKYVDITPPELKYTGTQNIFIKSGEFSRADFETVTAEDYESGVKGDVTADYGSFDQNVPGRYPVTFMAEDIAGNKAYLTRYIQVIGKNDVFAAINGEILVPGEQTNYWIGNDMELSFVNADKNGNKVSYAFVKGYYNGAELKGKSFKTLAAADAKISLEPEETGMYTLFMQTENRITYVMYVFIAG